MKLCIKKYLNFYVDCCYCVLRATFNLSICVPLYTPNVDKMCHSFHAHQVLKSMLSVHSFNSSIKYELFLKHYINHFKKLAGKNNCSEYI